MKKDFLMKLPVTSAQGPKIGTCPHGLPMGACPICSGSGAGGSGGMKKADFSAKPGEMSWAECAAIGQMLKNQKMHRAQDKQNFQAQMTYAAAFEKNLSAAAEKIAIFAQKMQNAPAIISKPINLLATKILVPVLNTMKAMPSVVQNVFSKIGEKLADISDKLNAMFGELKNSTEKKISDKLKDFKKKFKSIFAVIETKEADDEDKIDEEKRIFEQKNALYSINSAHSEENDKD